MSNNNSVQHLRLRLLSIAAVLIGVAVIVRLFTLQVVRGETYRERAEKQYIVPSDVFDRGNIFFSRSDGTRVAAASVESGFKLSITPARILHAEDAYKKLSSIIPIDREQFMTKASRTNDPYEEIAPRVSAEDAAKIEALNIGGVSLHRAKWRFYPGGTMASKTIGFVSFKKDTLMGTYGLEEYYNDVLSRRGGTFYVNFFAEIFANVGSTTFKNTAATGDVVTSIEPSVQAQLEDAVEGIEKRWQSDAVGGLVMDPYTGKILAMANYPTFDLNNFGAEESVSIYANPLTQHVYEMGSIIKPVVMASAIDAGVVGPKTTYFDGGSVVVADKTINNFDKRGRGTITMQDVLNQSLNTGMVHVQQKMGKGTFKEYMLDRFKLGTKTGIDLPSEGGGLVGNLKGSNDVNYATASFGQGIATTPINIVRAFGALANGGTLVTPHVATTIIDERGNERMLEFPAQKDPVISTESARTITDMLVQVVDDGYHLGLQHYRVAAKTGTAQIAKPGGGGYYDDRNLHSLIGYFPASNPKYVLYLYNVYPKGALYAIQTLADPFFTMVEFLTSYYHLPPDR